MSLDLHLLVHLARVIHRYLSAQYDKKEQSLHVPWEMLYGSFYAYAYALTKQCLLGNCRKVIKHSNILYFLDIFLISIGFLLLVL